MFGMADYGAFCAAILLFLALPGPGTLALLNSTATGGFGASAAATAGLIIGDQILLWLAVAGVAAMLAAHAAWFKALQVPGAAYLGWIGLRLLLVHSGRGVSPRRIQPHHYLRQALLITPCSIRRRSSTTWPSSRCSSIRPRIAAHRPSPPWR